MAASRIAHFLKCIARDKIGSFMERSDMEDFLKRWISEYVLLDPKATPEMKARYPLAEAEISVEEIPERLVPTTPSPCFAPGSKWKNSQPRSAWLPNFQRKPDHPAQPVETHPHRGLARSPRCLYFLLTEDPAVQSAAFPNPAPDSTG
jgi:hypothetical protein